MGQPCGEGASGTMSHGRRRTTSPMLLATASALMLACALLTPGARAAEPAIGGLGRVGASTIKPGTEGKSGQVNPRGIHDFVVDYKTGQFFIAEETGEGSKTVMRIQEFGGKGEFLAENRVSPKVGIEVGGLAIDAAKGRVYLLVTETRPEEDEQVLKEIEAKEKQIEAAERKGESTTKLEEELEELEEELAVADPGDRAAAEIWQFSAEASGGKLKEQKAVASAEALQTLSEEAKAPVIYPAGIAVDEKNHELVLLGQENTSPEIEEEELTTIVQRVHEEGGALGPRYVDNLNCLDEGAEIAGEPNCALKPHSEQPRSPIVTPQGNVLVELTQAAGEIWQIPTQVTEAGEAFKEVNVSPTRALTLTDASESQKLVNFGGSEEVPNTMAYVPVSETEGRIYVTANLEGNVPGVLVLDYTEQGGKPQVSEQGWTAGQSQVSKQEKCAIPLANSTIVLGGNSSGAVLILDTRPTEVIGEEEVPAVVAVMEFGSGGEKCGHVKVSPPVVKFGEQGNAEEVPEGTPTTITSTVTGANARGALWSFKYKTSGGEEGQEGPYETGYQYGATALTHEFQHQGTYEVTETVLTDNLGEPEVLAEKRTEKLVVGGGGGGGGGEGFSVKVGHLPVRIDEPATFEANVSDHNEEHPHLTYTWDFGDGTAPVVEEETASSQVANRKAQHTYLTKCAVTCLVTVTVSDGTGAETVGHVEVLVRETKAAEEERIALEAERRKPPASTTATTSSTTGTTSPGGNVLPTKEAHNPEAKIAGSSLSVSRSGAVTVKVSCPAGQSECVGSVTLRTAGAVSAKAKKKPLTLARGSFTVSGGQVKSITLHLSSKARALLAHSHTLRALATVVAHDASGTSRTTKASVTLRAAKASHKH